MYIKNSFRVVLVLAKSLGFFFFIILEGDASSTSVISVQRSSFNLSYSCWFCESFPKNKSSMCSYISENINEVVTPCSCAVSYQRSERFCCLDLHYVQLYIRQGKVVPAFFYLSTTP